MANLTNEELRNQSKYYELNIKKEGGVVKLRGKYLWVPYTGIRLMKEGTEFTPVILAELWIEKLDLYKIFQKLHKYFLTLPLVERMSVQGSWVKLREKLEKLPTQVAKLNPYDYF